MGIAILIASTLVSPWAPARADEMTSFVSSGHCIEYGTAVSVDAARARAVVPEGFVVLDVAGRAIAAMFAMDCTTSIGGAPAERSIVGGVFVFLDPVASPAGCQTYDFFWQDEPGGPWARALGDLGHPVEEVDGALVRDAFGIDASMPSALAPWTAHATAPETASPLPLVSVHCSVGSRGLVRGTYTHSLGVAPAGGEVVLGDGPLWRALGAQSSVAPGLWLDFTWSGITELVGS